MEKKLKKIKANKKFIIVPDEAKIESEIEILTPSIIKDIISKS